MTDFSLQDLVARTRAGDAAAMAEFAVRMGPAFCDEFIHRLLLKPFAEKLAISCIPSTISQLEQNKNADPVALINQVLDRAFCKWFTTLQTDVLEANDLQSTLFPASIPQSPFLEIGAKSQPLRPINGDLYDFIVQPDRILVAVLDASGKGAVAGLFAVLIAGLLRSFASTNHSPGTILRLMQQAMAGSATDSHYVTGLLLSYSLKSREICMASAGFSPPLIFSKGTQARVNLEPGPVIGLNLASSSCDYPEFSMSLAPGDWAAIFSDGITDQLNQAEEEYGVERISACVQDNGHDPAQCVVEKVFADLGRYSGAHSPQDDQTLIFLRVK